jgi:replicative DNA helicase
MSIFDATYDADAELEMQLLGAVMTLPDAFDRVADRLTRASFSHPALGNMWDAIQRLAVACKPFDPSAVYLTMRDAGIEDVPAAYVSQLASSAWGVSAVSAHADRIKRREVERNMAAAAAQIASMAHDRQMPLADKLAKAQALLADLNTSSVRKAPKHIGQIAVERTAHWEAIQSGEVVPGWPTHIPSLDNALNGGFKPGQLVILAARPSVGKSSFAEQLAITFAEGGLTTLFLSQEMPEEEVADRAASNTGRIDYGNIQSGNMTPEDWNRASEAMDKLVGLPFYVDDQPALTLMDVRTKARQVPGLKVLVLDYLQLCSGSGGDNRNAEIEQISRGLKSMAKEMGILVIALSQLNRKVEERTDKRPLMSDLRDSGAIEQDADVVIFLWPVRDRDTHRIVGCHVGKNRQGQKPAFGLHFTGSLQRWAQSTEDISPPAPPARPSRRGYGADND